MPRQHYYLLASLPVLHEPGSEPPITRRELLERVTGSAGPLEVVESLLLGDDLLQHEAVLAGEMNAQETDPAMLSMAQMRDEQPLPEYLAASRQEQAPTIAADALWAAYFRHAAAVAKLAGSEFLAAWTAFEVALRNALAAERAKALGLEAEGYLVAAELADKDADLAGIIGEWSAAPDPLAALRCLDMARWHWIAARDAWFSYSDDEVAAYAARLSLLHRWHSLSRQQREQTSAR